MMFSDPGDPPTDLEVQLLARSDDWVISALVAIVGVHSTLLICDELGGGTPLPVPTRRELVRRLYRPARDAAICEEAARGATHLELMDRYGLSRSSLRRVLRRGGVRRPRPSGGDTPARDKRAP